MKSKFDVISVALFLASFVEFPTAHAGNLLPTAEIHRIVARGVASYSEKSRPPVSEELLGAVALTPGVLVSIRNEAEGGCGQQLARPNFFGAVRRIRLLPNPVQQLLRDVFERGIPATINMVATARQFSPDVMADVPTLTFAHGAVRVAPILQDLLESLVTKQFKVLATTTKNQIGFALTPRIEVTELRSAGPDTYRIKATLTLGDQTVKIEHDDFRIMGFHKVDYDLASFLLTAATHFNHLRDEALFTREFLLLRSHVDGAFKTTGSPVKNELQFVLNLMMAAETSRHVTAELSRGAHLRDLQRVKAYLLDQLQSILREVLVAPPARPVGAPEVVVAEREGALTTTHWNHRPDRDYVYPSLTPHFNRTWLHDRVAAFNPDLAYLFPWASAQGGQIEEAITALFDVVANWPNPNPAGLGRP